MDGTASPYRLDELGWLQFERLCELVLEREAGLADVDWRGHSDQGRVALLDADVALKSPRVLLRGPVAVAVVWVRDDPSPGYREAHLQAAVSSITSELGFWFERALVLTNLDARQAQSRLERSFREVTQFAVLGAGELGESLDRHPELRAAMPSVLGLRDLGPLIAQEAGERSTLDIEAARELARVFWPTHAYARARAVLARHRFVVLTGPPEMGKTAIARMLGLAQLTDGWEAHECTSPEQVWRAFGRERAQVFVADDAFGSTEYRADAAELWARELGRLLRSLDDRHWLIWTSRPAPLKAGLRRVQRERGSERFPAPGEVLVDASDLDLAEKTLILFRHAKSRDADEGARRVLRSAGVSIVEHPHFTPERIRRFVAERLDGLPTAGKGDIGRGVLRVVERELARPTEAMRASFRALEDEHRELLIALLDAPAGLIDERELAATVRRHHTAGLRRPPNEVIDRLTDHFLRITPLGIGWVHPSWRDLVIAELRESAAARSSFLSNCGIYGVMLALSSEGGEAGERSLPLLIDDRDWDRLADGVAVLLRDLEDQDVARLMAALGEALGAELGPRERTEVESLSEYVLGAVRRAWGAGTRAIAVFELEAWYALNAQLANPVDPPDLGRTWTELHPALSAGPTGAAVADLQALDDWLAMAEVLFRYDINALTRLGFYERDAPLLAAWVKQLPDVDDPVVRALDESVLRRVREVSPNLWYLVKAAWERLAAPQPAERWWVPEDIPAPPSTELVAHVREGFTREDIERVLSDL